MKLISFLFLFLFAFNSYAAELMISQGSAKQDISQEDLEKKLHQSILELQDPVYSKHKRYVGYWLADIFDLTEVHLKPGNVLVFTALDGYKARVSYDDVISSQAKAFVAVKDLDVLEGWEKVQQGKEWVSPAPFYLVWKESQPASKVKLPWPYQIAAIEVQDTDEAQEKLLPEGQNRSESIVHGSQVFRESCLSCHSINLEGGITAPELNVPRNIMEYRSRRFVREFIRDPNSYRARSKMPGFDKGTLSDQFMEDLLNYLAWISKYKTGSE